MLIKINIKNNYNKSVVSNMIIINYNKYSIIYQFLILYLFVNITKVN